MFRLSCFHAHINGHKSKKTVQQSVESMHKTSEDTCLIQPIKDHTNHATLNVLFLESNGDAQLIDDVKNVPSSSSVDRGWKSDEMKGKYIMESDAGDQHLGLLKKSKSLGSGLFQEGRSSGSNETEVEIDRGSSHGDFHENNGLVVQDEMKDQGISPRSQYQDLPSESFQVSSDLLNNESISSAQDPEKHERDKGGRGCFNSQLSNRSARDSTNLTARATPALFKARSMPNISTCSATSGGRSPLKYLVPRSKSSKDLHVLNTRQGENLVKEDDTQTKHQGRDDGICRADGSTYGITIDDAYDSYNYVGSAKDWIMPVTDETRMEKKTHHGMPSIHRWDELEGKDFKNKRIEEWVMDLQHSGPLEEADELSFSNDEVMIGSTNLDGLNTRKMDAKVTPGMEAAKRYISSLNSAATAAQLANHGLVVIPFLSAFASLRVLNLSGNAIVRITAGALPRGLHMLNLSKNNISTIEGLRELTRLRILDLSYNRIFRIGHGLASCTSIKELYLAGNKISEVEGLHRLLKLNVLDLRFNKISTAKCLGQLAANYNSLQAISLEGNPAQKNVGDEQLKKYLQGLLPHLAYYNRQPIKTSTLKDASDRSLRLGISERALRSDPKLARKGGHGTVTHKPLSSSFHGRKNQAVVSSKLSKGRHVGLPPSGTKATANTNHRHNYFDFGSKLLGLKTDLSMRRSRSEGTLGGL